MVFHPPCAPNQGEVPVAYTRDQNVCHTHIELAFFLILNFFNETSLNGNSPE